MKLVLRFAAIAIASLGFSEIVNAQAPAGAPVSYLWCYVSGPTTSPTSWAPCSVSNPLPTTGSGGGGASNVNVTQFGGNNVVTGTGISGLGIPRFTVSSDSSINAVQSGTWTVQPGNTANTTPWLVNLAAGSAVIGHVITDTGSTTAVTALPSIPTGANTIGAVTQAGSPWTVTGAGGTFPVTGTVTANAGTNLNTSLLALESGGNLATLAGIVTSSRAAVNPISGQSGVTGGTGVVGAATQRVTLATDVALPTGSNTIGAVTQASGPWTQNITQFGGTNISTGTGAGGTGIPRVTVSNDSAIINNGFATTSAPTYTTSTYNPLSLDTAGNLRVVTASSSTQTLAPTSSSTAALSHASTTALGTSLVASATAANLYAYNCSGITGGSAGFCIVYNGSSAPGTGALTGANVLDYCFFGTTPQGCSLSRIPMMVNYSTGIVVLISTASSPFTYTTGTATGAITVDYK